MIRDKMQDYTQGRRRQLVIGGGGNFSQNDKENGI